jgi:chromosome segregation ATPase
MAKIMSTNHRLHTLRADLNHLTQRLDRTEQRINDLEERITQLTTALDTMKCTTNHKHANKEG